MTDFTAPRRMPAAPTSLVALLLGLCACSGAQISPSEAQQAQQASPDSPNVTAGSTTSPASSGLPPLPIDAQQLAQTALNVEAAPVGSWTWIDVPEARCGNGAQTGFGINRAASSNTLMIYMQGGGACSDAIGCYVSNLATFVASGYNATEFQNDQGLLNSFVLTSRTSTSNPLATAHLAYIPYCTGDVHSGNNIITYPGAPQTTYHLGAVKTQLSAAVLAAAFPQVTRIVLAGSSAGGFGVVIEYGVVAATFSGRRVDMISDSGVNPDVPPSRPPWNSPNPLGCAACDTNHYATFLPAYAQAYPTSRFAALSFQTDNVLPGYLGVSQSDFVADIASYFVGVDKAANARTFLAPGVSHVVLNSPTITSGGQTLASFLADMLTDSAGWHAAP